MYPGTSCRSEVSLEATTKNSKRRSKAEPAGLQQPRNGIGIGIKPSRSSYAPAFVLATCPGQSTDCMSSCTDFRLSRGIKSSRFTTSQVLEHQNRVAFFGTPGRCFLFSPLWFYRKLPLFVGIIWPMSSRNSGWLLPSQML